MDLKVCFIFGEEVKSWLDGRKGYFNQGPRFFRDYENHDKNARN